MSNMSYCRFENTAQDLRDCLDNFDAVDDLGDAEKKARLRIIKMAREIAFDYGDEVTS